MNSKPIPTVIGLDIGAHSTKIAAVQRGAIDVITNEANFRQTPSVIGYGEGERKIGEAGNVKLKSNFKNSVISPLRFLSLQEGSEEAIREVSFCPCPSSFENEALKFTVSYQGRSENFSPEQILASYLTEVSNIIRYNNLDQKLIVIAVPSYFTQAERKAVLAASQIANLKNVQLIDDAVAMGLDYGAFKKNQMGDGKNVLFIDFGHSRFSTCLIKFTNSEMEVIANQCNRNLGCRDIDTLVFEKLAQKFNAKTGLHLSENKKACLKLLEVIQRQRKILSGIHETEVSIECLMEDEDMLEPFTRDLMKDIAKQVFDELRSQLHSLKEAISERQLNIDVIELVGGGSRIPEVISIINQVFGIKPSRTINSNETIARGATLAAVQQSGLFRFHNYKIIRKSAMPIKISWKSESSEMEAEDDYPALQCETIFEEDEMLPIQREFKFNASGKVEMLAAYDILDEAILKKIIKIEFELQQNEEATAIFELDENGFISVKKIQKGGDRRNVEFRVREIGGLTAERIAECAKKEREMYVRDFNIVQGYEKKNLLEGLIYAQRQKLHNQEITEFLDPSVIGNATARFDGILMEISDESSQHSIREYQQKEQEVLTIIRELEDSAAAKKKERQLIREHFGELEKVKQQATESMNFIAKNYRNSRSVSQAYEQIKEIQDWAEEAIRVSKEKPANQLPIVSQKEIQTQKSNIEYIMQQLAHQRPQQQNFMASPRYQETPRRRQRTDYDPFGMSRSAYLGDSLFGGRGFF